MSVVLGGLREEFLSGDQGDCTLKFIVSGEIVAERKAESVILKQVPHFKRQLQFEEGKTKVFTIDITDFMEDVTLSAKEFVEVSLVVLFDGDVRIDENIDIVSRFGIVKFREYLELPFAKVLEVDSVWDEDSTPRCREFVINMIRNCSLNLCEGIVKHGLHLLEKDVSELRKERAAKAGDDVEQGDSGQQDGEDTEFEFHEKWKIAYDLMLELLQGDSDSEQRGVFVLRNLLTDDFFNSLKDNGRDLMCLGGGADELATLGLYYNIDPWFTTALSAEGIDGFHYITSNLWHCILKQFTKSVVNGNGNLPEDLFHSGAAILALAKYKRSRLAVQTLLAGTMCKSVIAISDDMKEKNMDTGNILKPIFDKLQACFVGQSYTSSIAWLESVRDLEKENEQLKKDMSEAGQSSSSQVGIKRQRVD